VNFHLKMQSANVQVIFNSMNVCVKKGRAYQHVDPDRSMQEIEKLAILSEVLESVRNFESKLLSDMDID
jgi:hypothetical protein